jgi:SOS-response transcriptional repressor LexA
VRTHSEINGKLSKEKKKLLSERLTKLLVEKGLTIPKFSQKLSEDERKVRNWVNGDFRPRAEKLIEIARILEVSVESLISEAPIGLDPVVSLGMISESGMRRVPIVSEAQAGTILRDYQDHFNQSEEFVWSNTKDRNAFAVRIVGHSMEGFAFQGDIAIFNPNEMAQSGQAALVKFRESEAVMFKWFFIRDEQAGKVLLGSENRDKKAYPSIECSLKDLQFYYRFWDLKKGQKIRNIMDFLPPEKKAAT